VQFTPEAIRAIGSDSRGVNEAEANRIFRGLGLKFHQNDPLANDAELKSYFSTVVDNEARANRIVERLISSSFVKGAYIKPIDAPPQ